MSRSNQSVAATTAPASQYADAQELNPASSTPRSRPRSGAASATASGATAARPFSSSNLSASIANARFKTFQVQYEILSKNPVLSAIAREIPWRNLLDLFLLKFYAVGDILWLQDEQPHEMVFVLCGGFLARHMDRVSEPVDLTSQSYSSAGAGTGAQPAKGLGMILAEKMVKPGGNLAVLSVHTNTHMQYSVVTAKFKSIVLSLPTGKYKSILRQLTPELSALMEHLLYDTENKLLSTLKMRPIAPPKDTNSKQQQQRSSRDKHSHKHSSSPNKKNQPATSLQRAASTPALNNISSSLQSSATISLDATASWASLQVAKPVEYEVNSSLLILHQPSSSSTGNLHHLAPSMAAASSTSKKSVGAAGALLHSSSAARLTAKKHTQRRLQSIKFPNPLEAFPPQSKNMGLADDHNLVDQAMLALLNDTGGGGGSKRAVHLDVVPKVHVGRLLKPLRKPVMFSDDSDFNTKSSNNSSSSASKRGCAGARSHTVAQEQMHQSQQRVLVADRAEPFRDVR